MLIGRRSTQRVYGPTARHLSRLTVSSPAVTNLAPDDRQAARVAFTEWASLQPHAPRDVGALVDDVEAGSDYVGLISTDVEGRRLVWKSVPASVRSRVTLPQLASGSVDPWTVNVSTLREQSDHIAICATCDGARKVTCAHCAGFGRTRCTVCGGQQKVWGYTSNGARRLLNCSYCRGKGDLECNACHRGKADCVICRGEGRVQQWLELEQWRRSETLSHPPEYARRFCWSDDPPNAMVSRDVDLAFEVEQPRRLTRADLATVPPRWLDVLMPATTGQERIVRQRLRIARVPTQTIRYHLGSLEDRASFMGHRLTFLPSDAATAFEQRAASLRRLAWVLLFVGIVIATLALGRGAFYLSVPTFGSLVSVAAMLGTLYGAAYDWTAGRRQTRRWLIASGASLLVAIVMTIVALPRLGHARERLAAGDLDAAEAELTALGSDADPETEASLHLARVRAATDLETARSELAKIPRDRPEHRAATTALDASIVTTAEAAARERRWVDGAAALATLSESARGTPAAIAAAKAIYVPSADAAVGRRDWQAAADAVAAARTIGVDRADLAPFVDAIHAAGTDTAAEASHTTNVRRRLRLRLTAEATLAAWEKASGETETPQLSALRGAMAADVAAVETLEHRNGS